MSTPTDPKDLPENETLFLHIGGHQLKEGWKILNINPSSQTDFVGSAVDLKKFKDNSIEQIYASHVYEHLSYVQELPTAISEAYRVLKPGGIFRASVPDLEILAKLILDPMLDHSKKFQVMRMIYGGQTDRYDYHKVGLNFELFASLLTKTGFIDIQRVKTFGLFNDNSDMLFENVLISLNIMAKNQLPQLSSESWL